MGAGACDGGDDAGGVYLADDVVGGLGEVEIALGVEDYGGGEDEGDGGGGDGGLRCGLKVQKDEQEEDGCSME